MKAFFEAIEDLFVNGLFTPYDFFRFMDDWWLSNLVNWLLIIAGTVAMIYWMGQLKKFHDSGEEDKDITAHSYL